jgi:hypothetical protein
MPELHGWADACAAIRTVLAVRFRLRLQRSRSAIELRDGRPNGLKGRCCRVPYFEHTEPDENRAPSRGDLISWLPKA